MTNHSQLVEAAKALLDRRIPERDDMDTMLWDKLERALEASPEGERGDGKGQDYGPSASASEVVNTTEDPRVAKWQPIESAPKGHILVQDRGGEFHVAYRGADGRWYRLGVDAALGEVVCWRHLPDAAHPCNCNNFRLASHHPRCPTTAPPFADSELCCERHPEKAFPHDDCPGPGMTAPNPPAAQPDEKVCGTCGGEGSGMVLDGLGLPTVPIVCHDCDTTFGDHPILPDEKQGQPVPPSEGEVAAEDRCEKTGTTVANVKKSGYVCDCLPCTLDREGQRIEGKHVYAATNVRGEWMVWMRDEDAPIERLLRGPEEIDRDEAESWVRWWDGHAEYFATTATTPTPSPPIPDSTEPAVMSELVTPENGTDKTAITEHNSTQSADTGGVEGPYWAEGEWVVAPTYRREFASPEIASVVAGELRAAYKAGASGSGEVIHKAAKKYALLLARKVATKPTPYWIERHEELVAALENPASGSDGLRAVRLSPKYIEAIRRKALMFANDAEAAGPVVNGGWDWKWREIAEACAAALSDGGMGDE